ncbi:MAG: hypothetical protein ACO25G_01260 [Holophagaceae bacterium]|jgi:hypothetical protein|nr:hypothetical protein [Acidobacteriota bacterium]
MNKLKINLPTNLLQSVLNAKPVEGSSKSAEATKSSEKNVDTSKVKMSTKPTNKPSNLGFTRSSNRGK